MFQKDKFELGQYLFGVNQQEINNERIIPNNLLFLYYEIRSITNNDKRAKEVLKKLFEYGLCSLKMLLKMGVSELELCDFKEFSKETHLNPDFQSYIYENCIDNNGSIHNSINLLKQQKILTKEQFQKINLNNIQQQFQLQFYQNINQKENAITNQHYSQNLCTSLVQKSSKSCNTQESNNQDNEKIDIIIKKIQTGVDFTQSSECVQKIGNIQILKYKNYSEYFARQPNEIKTILFFGQTGAGKTSLINYILNYHFQIKFQDNPRLIFNDCSNKTQDIITYYIPPFNNKPELLIIDTPGFGSINDESVNKQILNFLMSQMKYITLVCFVIKASTPRLTVQELSVLNYIDQIFGLNFVNNCIFTFTFSDSGSPQALESLTLKGDKQQKGSPVAQLISKMGNNWWIKINNQSLLAENSGDDNQFNQMQWNQNMKSLELLYQNKLMVQQNVNCSVFKQQKKQIEINTLNDQKNELTKLLTIIKDMKRSFKEHQNNNKYDYPIEIKVLEFQEKSIPLVKSKWQTEIADQYLKHLQYFQIASQKYNFKEFADQDIQQILKELQWIQQKQRNQNEIIEHMKL